MARLGLSQTEFDQVSERGALDGIDVRFLMSHLVRAYIGELQ
jgi:hypothetical protein